MTGPYNGLCAKLISFCNKNLVCIHCMAHRLQIATGHAFENEKIFQK